MRRQPVDNVDTYVNTHLSTHGQFHPPDGWNVHSTTVATGLALRAWPTPHASTLKKKRRLLWKNFICTGRAQAFRKKGGSFEKISYAPEGLGEANRAGGVGFNNGGRACRKDVT